VLQCVAVCCSVLQCVAVRCSAPQNSTRHHQHKPHQEAPHQQQQDSCRAHHTATDKISQKSFCLSLNSVNVIVSWHYRISASAAARFLQRTLRKFSEVSLMVILYVTFTRKLPLRNFIVSRSNIRAVYRIMRLIEFLKSQFSSHFILYMYQQADFWEL